MLVCLAQMVLIRTLEVLHHAIPDNCIISTCGAQKYRPLYVILRLMVKNEVHFFDAYLPRAEKAVVEPAGMLVTTRTLPHPVIQFLYVFWQLNYELRGIKKL